MRAWEIIKYFKYFFDHILKYETLVVALATFAWLRRGRLWRFYFAMLQEAIKQSVTHSLDRNAWDKLTETKIIELTRDYFGALFEFEVEYLRDFIQKTTAQFSVPDSSSSVEMRMEAGLQAVQSGQHAVYYNKAKHAEDVMRNTIRKKFRFVGISLFCSAFVDAFIVSRFRKRDPGYVKTNIRIVVHEYLKEIRDPKEKG